ncbi:MAG: glutathione synthase [Clostridia bacterium]
MNSDNKYIFDGLFGLERETLRITADGSLSQSPHPFTDNIYLDRDFCENQLELITPVCNSIDTLIETLTQLDKYTKDELLKIGEYLWMSSNPPHIETELDIPIANFSGNQAFKYDYRQNLARRYGKRLMLYSGIHFNFSFSEKFLQSIYDEKEDFKTFKNSLYFRLSKQVSRYSWLLVLLTAASPVYDLSLDGDYLTGDGFDGHSSLRSSERGYWNKFIPNLNYSSLESYIESIETYISSGKLISETELYLPVRLKPLGDNRLESFIQNGTDHIELRMFDVNPLSPIGIFREDLYFTHYYLIYLLSLPDFEYTPHLQETAIKNHRSAAQYNLDNIMINGYPAIDAGLGLLNDMSIYFKNIPEALNIIELQKKKLSENKRYCVKIYERLHKDFQRKMLELSKKLSS